MGEACPLGLQPEEVLDPEQLPLMDAVALHRLKVAPRALLPHDGGLQLLQEKWSRYRA